MAGDSAENSRACPIRNVLKKLLWFPVRVGLFLNAWWDCSLCIINLEIKTFDTKT